MIEIRADPSRCWRIRQGKDRAPSWYLDGTTLWCDSCDDGTRCGVCAVKGWPEGFEFPLFSEWK